MQHRDVAVSNFFLAENEGGGGFHERGRGVAEFFAAQASGHQTYGAEGLIARLPGAKGPKTPPDVFVRCLPKTTKPREDKR